MSLGINAGLVNAQSQAFEIEVPFEFTANDTTLPAGRYIVNSNSDNRVMWRIQGTQRSVGALLIAGSLSNVREYEEVWLTFRRYGDRNFLGGFKTGSYQVNLAISAFEKDVRRSWNGEAKNQTAIVKANSGR